MCVCVRVCVCVCVYIYIYNSSLLDIEHSSYHIAFGSTETDKVI